jgi:hypothetical protein
MAYHRLGEHEKSRKVHDAALELMRNVAPPAPSDAASTSFIGWLDVSLRHREAKAVLGLSDEPTPKPERAAPSAAPPEQQAGERRANK